MKYALIPGSFDPLTLGHLDIIKRASMLFEKVYVVIMINSEKKGMFSFAQRKEIAEASCKEFPNVSVITADGILAELAASLDCVIVKGLRNSTDFDYEQGLAYINDAIVKGTETVLLPASREYMYISSSYARELIRYKKSLYATLHPDAIKIIEKYMACTE